MQIITLTTDVGLKDYYVASIKGALFSALSSPVIIDISHEIKPFDTSEAAFQLRNCYRDFPKGTIHVIGVDSEPHLINSNQDSSDDLFAPSYPCILLFNEHYFIANDNGFFGAFLGDQPATAFYRYKQIENHPEMQSFPTKNCFVPLAIKIICGETPATFCEIASDFKIALLQNPIIESFSIQGNVIHIDSFGNLISNITKKDFDRFGENVPFVIYYFNKSYHLEKISPTYNSVAVGDKVAIFNNAGLLEIAINQGANRNFGGADKLFGVRKGDVIRVNFEPAGSHKSINTLQF